MRSINAKALMTAFVLLLSVFVLSGCREKVSFEAGDIKDDYCGAYLNFQYCKCAFHNEYCEAIGMKKGEAKDFVYEQYDKWVKNELAEFQANCRKNNGIVKEEACIKCNAKEIAKDDECVAYSEAESATENGKEDETEDQNSEGICKYDSDCDSICEGTVMWKMGCDPRQNACVKTFDTDCASDIENFGGMDFPKSCQQGSCIRDQVAIEAARVRLENEKELWSKTVKEINRVRADINTSMLEANKNCINGIADMTNVAIMEFATRVGSVLAGGIPDVAAMSASAAEKASGLMAEHVKNLAGAAVDYVGEGVNRLSNYQNGEPVEAEKKLKPDEYIKLNCGLYEYFKNVETESAAELQTALDLAEAADSKLKALPQ